MATNKRRTSTYSWAAGDDATFRAWGKNVSDSLVAIGLVRAVAADWTTLLRPGTANASAAGERFDFGGPLQATFPIRFELHYGWSGSPAHGLLAFRVFGGSAQTNAPWLGNTGTTTAMTNLTAATSYIASDGENWATVWLGSDLATNGNFCVTIERTRDDTGAYTAEGVYVTTGGYGKWGWFWAGAASGESTNHYAGALCALPYHGTHGTTSVRGGRVALFPHILPHAGQPPQAIYGAFGGDYANKEEIVLPDGRRYIACMAEVHANMLLTTGSASWQSSPTYGRQLVRVDGASV